MTTSGQDRPTGERLTWLGTTSLVGLWAVSYLWYPFGWDQGIFAWVGSVILDGGMPFRDAFDLKGPAAHYVFASAQALFGHNLWGIRLVDLVGLVAVVWMLSRFVDALTEPGTGRWGAALLVLWYAGLTFWHTAQPDGFAATFLALGFLPMLVAGPRVGVGHALLAGAAVGLAAAIKPNYAAFGLVPTVLLFGFLGSRPKELALRFGATILAAALVVGGFVAWFAFRGALADLWEIHIAYNATTYSSGSSLAIEERLRGIVDYVLAGNVFVVLLPAAILGLDRLRRSHPVEALSLVTWAALAAGGVVLQNKFFEYQWAPLLVPVTILGTVGVRSAIGASARGEVGATSGLARTPRAISLGHVLFAVILAHASIHPAFEVLNWGSYVAGFRDEVSYYDTFGVPGNDLRVVRYLEAHAAPDDPLLVMAWNIEIQYMTDLPTVTRLAYSLPLWMGEGTEYRMRYRAEFLRDLDEQRPQWIVVGSQALPLLGREVTLDEFPEFEAVLREEYELEAQFGDLALHRRRDTAAGIP